MEDTVRTQQMERDSYPKHKDPVDIRTRIKRNLCDCNKCEKYFCMKSELKPLSNIKEKIHAHTWEETNDSKLGEAFSHGSVLTLYQSTCTQEKPLEGNEGGKPSARIYP